jgi:hypothetical protein
MNTWGFKEWAEFATAGGVVVAAISLVVGVIGAWISARNDRREKQARAFEVIHDRYQRMADKRRALTARTDAKKEISDDETYDFYASYWSMQIDVWEYYRLGVISESVYATWLAYLYDHLEGFTVIGKVNSRKAWEEYGRSLSRNNVEFKRLIESLYELGARGSAPPKQRDISIASRLEVRSQIQQILHDTPKWMRSGSPQ